MDRVTELWPYRAGLWFNDKVLASCIKKELRVRSLSGSEFSFVGLSIDTTVDINSTIISDSYFCLCHNIWNDVHFKLQQLYKHYQLGLVHCFLKKWSTTGEGIHYMCSLGDPDGSAKHHQIYCRHSKQSGHLCQIAWWNPPFIWLVLNYVFHSRDSKENSKYLSYLL